MAAIKKMIIMMIVIFSSLPSFDRPLFLLQYVSEPPLIEPESPADLPSCRHTATIKITLAIVIMIVAIK